MEYPSTHPAPLMSTAVELVRCYGSSWNLKRADRVTWVADRTTGTATEVIAGTSAEVLQRLDTLPKQPVDLCAACSWPMS